MSDLFFRHQFYTIMSHSRLQLENLVPHFLFLHASPICIVAAWTAANCTTLFTTDQTFFLFPPDSWLDMFNATLGSSISGFPFRAPNDTRCKPVSNASLHRHHYLISIFFWYDFHFFDFDWECARRCCYESVTKNKFKCSFNARFDVARYRVFIVLKTNGSSTFHLKSWVTTMWYFVIKQG